VGHQVVVQERSVLAGGAAVTADGVGMDVDQSGRLADAAALGDMVEDREDGRLGQVGAIQRGPLAFGEAGAAGAAVEQPILAVLTEAAGDGEISRAAASEVKAVGILTAEAKEIIHGAMCWIEVKAPKGLERLLKF
jgi:hypothetical protein